MFVRYDALVILFLFMLSSVIGAEEVDSGKKHKTVLPPNTAVLPPNTTVLPPNTTVLPPNTTVLPPNTTVTPPTTAAPNTTIAPITTTTVAPDVEPGVWNVSFVNGTNCILAKMAIDFSVPYKTKQNETKIVHFIVPTNSSAMGSCSNVTDLLALPFANSSGIINFTFSYNASTHEYYMSQINVKVAVNNNTFPNNTWENVKELPFTYKGELFKSNVGMSYTCSSPDSIKCENSAINGTSLKMSSIHLEAFGLHKYKTFSQGVDCVTGETPDIVPIAVGLALALLVIVVLIGFIVSRRRSQSRGYLSM